MTQPTIEQLQAEIAAMKAAQNQQTTEAQRRYLQSLPVAERPLYERQLALAERERKAQEREDFLNTAALAITRKEMATKLFLPESEFEGLESIEAITQKARELTINMPAEQLERMAALQRQLESGVLPTPEGEPAAPPAAGATMPPTGAGTAAGGGTAPSGPSPSEEITARHAGKGATDVAAWLAEKRAAVPMQDVSFGNEFLAPAPPPAGAGGGPVSTQGPSGEASPSTPPVPVS